MPLVKELMIHGATHIDSLSFLKHGSVRHMLQRLFLSDFSPRMPAAEISSVLALRRLDNFDLRRVLDARLQEEKRAV